MESVAPVPDAPRELDVPRKSARRPFALLGLAAGVVLAGLGVYAMATGGRESTDDAQVAADVVAVGARVAGQVIKVAIVENQRVKKGELLVKLDDSDYRARVKQAEAQLATAQAQAAAADAQVRVTEASSKGGLASARAAWSGSSVGVASAEAQIAVSRANLGRAQAEAHKAELDLERQKALRAENAVPQQALDNAQVAFDAASAALTQARAQLGAAEEQKRAAQAHVAEAEGQVEGAQPTTARIAAARAQAALAHAGVQAAEAQLDLQRLQLGWTEIQAPTDGVASKLMAREGSLVNPGQTALQLVPTATYVVANFKETQIGRMKPGDPADIEIDAFPGRSFVGRVESLSGGTGASFALIPPDNASGNFVKVVQRVPVRIGWTPPADVKMRAGMSADVTVRVK
jgi:membrane fusion protein (multidrug efflux system)